MKVNLDTPVMQKATIYNDGDLAFIDDLSDLNLDSMAQNEIFVIALCLQGKASLHIDGVPYVAYPNDIFICPPNVIINDCLLSVDFKCYCIGMTLSYIQEIVPMADCNWDVRLWFQIILTLHFRLTMRKNSAVITNCYATRLRTVMSTKRR